MKPNPYNCYLCGKEITRGEGFLVEGLMYYVRKKKKKGEEHHLNIDYPFCSKKCTEKFNIKLNKGANDDSGVV